ncbi:MAG TPA: lipid-binding SYLF domain-containing protein [Candidatus Limnocylindria bacterium]|nr:lipid-binding SYLF domain-containing protein [Candidatus Limnocylindria bacterium]
MIDTRSQDKGYPLVRAGLSFLLTGLLAVLFLLPAFAGDKEKDEETLKNAASVLLDMVNSGNIPSNILAQSNCIIVLPGVKKVGFGIGGSGGRGAMSCRAGDKFTGKWSAPAMYSIGGASVGFQVGATSSDFVLLVTTDKGVNAVLEDKTKLGSDATAAAGPGATAQSSSVGGADVYTYARAKGLFAGVSLEGATLHPDKDANERIYGKQISGRDIVRGNTVKTTGAGQPLVSLLDSKVPKHAN